MASAARLTDMLWTLLGLACAIYTAVELTRARMLPAAFSGARFGAVDAESGQPLDVVIDRRTRTDPRLMRRRRRRYDR